MIKRFLSSQFSGYLAIISIAVLIGMYFYIRHLGYEQCKKDVIVEAVKKEDKRDEIETEVIRLDDSNLRKRYCEWVRDSKDECLQADIPVSEGQNDKGDDATDSSSQ